MYVELLEKTRRFDLSTLTTDLDSIVAVVEQLTSSNSAQYWIDAVVDDIVSADRRQSRTLNHENNKRQAIERKTS